MQPMEPQRLCWQSKEFTCSLCVLKEPGPLNLTDALGYLDTVKKQFQNQPEVYHHFLDIMKDFNRQVIDTPGVIQRVSTLFPGNRILIQGFNSFLPLGYRIDISENPAEPHTITVTTPMGTTTHLQQHQPLFNQPQTTATSFLGNLNNHSTVDKQRQPESEEFNHAIQYLNKIEARYADEPNKYTQFLDILQTYQKEQKHLRDHQVYVQVQHLFKDAPDLLAEFKVFLPEMLGGQ
ncbi:paired amphipathic helix [Mycena olivaceomarginata]|nr:paired amphipathic helix [Mycena olivaceomarginata]